MSGHVPYERYIPGVKELVVKLLDPQGKTVTESVQQVTYRSVQAQCSLNVSFELKNLQLWTAETPTLYTLHVVQRENGKEEMAFSTKYGFRDIAIKNALVYINGQRVFFKGTNRHDTHPLYEQHQYHPHIALSEFGTYVCDVRLLRAVYDG